MEEKEQKELTGTVSTAFLQAPAAEKEYIQLEPRELPKLLRHFEYTGDDLDALNDRYLYFFSRLMEGRENAPDHVLNAMIDHLFKEYEQEYEYIRKNLELTIGAALYQVSTDVKLYKPATKYRFWKWRWGKNRPAKFVVWEKTADANRTFADRQRTLFANYPELKRAKKAEKKEARRKRKEAKKAERAARRSAKKTSKE